MRLQETDRPAPDVTLQGEGDAPVALAETWRDRPAVLIFLRHFG
ncbi:MAG: hypothetical protein R3263_08640 [Myxococcota bacterium]|nr:hypothetical protein [Myxococcota bacterium]